MPSPLEAQLAQAVQAALAPTARYLGTVMRLEPGKSSAWLLRRPDVDATLTDALTEAREAAEAIVLQAWDSSGGADEPVIERLLADINRAIGTVPHLHDIIRKAHPDGPEAVWRAVLDHARQAALRGRLTVSMAHGAAKTAAVIAAGHEAQGNGETVYKRWRSRKSPKTCYWCRKLDGVTIAIDGDFRPHLGGPVQFPRQQERKVATPAGEKRFGQAVGSPIIYTYPPKPYHGKLLGPLLHPHCECWLELVNVEGVLDGEEAFRPRSPAPQAPEGFLSAEDIRKMPEAKYRSLVAFLEAAVHELGQVLRRLAHRG